MENAMKIFENKDFGKVRTVVINETPWFVGKDIAKCLGYSDANKAVAMHVEDDDKKLNDKTSPSFGQRGATLINESGVYALIFGSKLPKAKEFKHWVTSEVLPSIRKNGAYMTPKKVIDIIRDPNAVVELCKQIVDFQKELVEQKKETEAYKAELDYSKEWYSIKRVAKMNDVSWRDISWRALKAASKKCGRGVKKIFDANYGEVNTYHMDAWEIAYPEFEL